MRLTIAAALLLSACTAPDWCHRNQTTTDTCLELKRLGRVAECRCEAKASGPQASTPDKPNKPTRPPERPDYPEHPDWHEPRDVEPHDHSEPGDHGGYPHQPTDPRYHPRHSDEDRGEVGGSRPSHGRW